MTHEQLHELLERDADKFNHRDFIINDPIQIPHRFTLRQDVEIAAFFAAMLAWGQRKTIINKCNELLAMMDNAPYQFMLHHTESDLRRILSFKHRTFNATDALHFIAFFTWYYRSHTSLEEAFAGCMSDHDPTTEKALRGFHELFFSLEDSPHRTRKHVATPARGSTCKRLQMFLRWMVRCDNRGVDFGLWQRISPAQLLMPLDVHVERVARQLGLLERSKADWKAVIELTNNLRAFDPLDPVRYDFALFGRGVLGLP